MTGFEQVLASALVGIGGIGLGKLWGGSGKVNMERCRLIHEALEERLERIEKKIDRLNEAGGTG